MPFVFSVKKPIPKDMAERLKERGFTETEKEYAKIMEKEKYNFIKKDL